VRRRVQSIKESRSVRRNDDLAVLEKTTLFLARKGFFVRYTLSKTAGTVTSQNFAVTCYHINMRGVQGFVLYGVVSWRL